MKNFSYRNSRPLRPEKLSQIYRTLRNQFGHQHWWHGETPFEIIVGAILTQNTAWVNVEKALANLKAAKVLNPNKMYRLSFARLAALIRPAGYFNVKALRLKNFLDFFIREYAGSIKAMKSEPLSILRAKLLQVNGIGPETADSILLYALNKPSFVIDAYTVRVFSRHRLEISREIPLRALDAKLLSLKYYDWQELFHQQLPRSVSLFNDFHAQIVHLSKVFCRSSNPDCPTCPLRKHI